MPTITEEINKMNVYQKLFSARLDFQKNALKKSGRASGLTKTGKMIKFDYFELADIVPLVLELQERYHIFFKFDVENNQAILSVIDIDKPESVIQFKAPVDEATVQGGNKVQGIGAMLTYMRRYMYMSVFDIIENDILDANIGKNNNTPTKKESNVFDFSDLKTLEQINHAFKTYQANKSNDWKLPLLNRAKVLGFEYDKNTKAFTSGLLSKALGEFPGATVI